VQGMSDAEIGRLKAAGTVGEFDKLLLLSRLAKVEAVLGPAPHERGRSLIVDGDRVIPTRPFDIVRVIVHPPNRT
jgi:hypothetical protein